MKQLEGNDSVLFPFIATGSLLVGRAAGADLVLDLQGSQSLMVQHFASVSPVEVEVSVREVHKRDDGDEDEEPGVIAISGGVKRIVTNLITVWQVVDVVLFLPGVSTSVRRERVLVIVQWKVVLVPVVVRNFVSEVAGWLESVEYNRLLVARGHELVVAVGLDDRTEASEGSRSDQSLHSWSGELVLQEHFLIYKLSLTN